MARLRFVLCADDYGMTPAVSRGILEVAAAGRVSAASAMSSMPDWPRAAREWRAARPDADLGLHVNLTAGAPLGPMPRLAPSGVLPPLPRLVAAALARRLPLDEIEAEIGRQIDAFVSAHGAPPDHVDGHQHVHALPGVRAALFSALASRGLAGALLRNSADRLSRIAARGAMAAKAAQVRALGAGFGRAAHRAGYALNDGFAGFSDFAPGRYGADLFASYLKAPGARHLVMCHPGHVDEALVALDPVTDAREAEWRWLMSPGFAQALERRGAALVRQGMWLSRP